MCVRGRSGHAEPTGWSGWDSDGDLTEAAAQTEKLDTEITRFLKIASTRMRETRNYDGFVKRRRQIIHS